MEDKGEQHEGKCCQEEVALVFEAAEFLPKLRYQVLRTIFDKKRVSFRNVLSSRGFGIAHGRFLACEEFATSASV